MNVYRIYILIIDLFFTPLLMIDKKGENDFELYACLLLHLVYAYMFLLMQKGEKVFGEKTFWFMHIVSHLVYAYIFV